MTINGTSSGRWQNCGMTRETIFPAKHPRLSREVYNQPTSSFTFSPLHQGRTKQRNPQHLFAEKTATRKSGYVPRIAECHQQISLLTCAKHLQFSTLRSLPLTTKRIASYPRSRSDREVAAKTNLARATAPKSAFGNAGLVTTPKN